MEELRAKNPNIIFVCDPVMGDNGRFYVPKENLAIYRDQLLKMADIITPNQFEAEYDLLTFQSVLYFVNPSVTYC